MNHIKKLPPDQIQKIAAGEVVERPVNIVKELIENALDASATSVTLYLDDGGKKLIRVVDNGQGMSEEDAHLCFEHHATSKLTSIDDLATLHTFGFRGEALSSIASVSTITLITKQDSAQSGTRVTLQTGVVQSTESAASTEGTDLQVVDLFSNIPARKKFLKSRDTEWRQINILIHAFCLSNLAVHFKVVSEGNLVINCPPASSLAERITQLKHHQLARQLLTIDIKDKRIVLKGCISDHHFFRYDRSSIYFFVNGRWIKNHTLTRALLKGYSNVLPDGRFPAATLFISIDSDQIDINIHPKKEEVKFLYPRHVEALITKSVQKALEQNISAYLTQQKRSPINPQSVFDLPPQQYLHNPTNKTFYRLGSEFPPAPSNSNGQSAQKDPLDFVQTTVSQTVSEQWTPERNYTLIGQFKKTYLLIEKEEGLLVVDQHAAQERIFYELFAHQFKQLPTIELLFPQTIVLTEQDALLLEPHLDLFKDNGIGLQIFGKDQILVQSTPVHLKHIQWSSIVHKALVWIQEYKDLEQQEFQQTIHKKLQAQMACKAAVKAGDILATEQIHQLLDDLDRTANRFSCPHGRPTCWLLSVADIEKKFKRRK